MKLMVSYHHIKNNQHGFGNCCILVPQSELTMEVVRDMEREIKEQNGNDGVVIINIIKLDA